MNHGEREREKGGGAGTHTIEIGISFLSSCQVIPALLLAYVLHFEARFWVLDHKLKFPEILSE